MSWKKVSNGSTIYLMKQERMIDYHCKCIQGRKEKKRSGRKKTSPIILHARLLLWPLPVPHPGEKKKLYAGIIFIQGLKITEVERWREILVERVDRVKGVCIYIYISVLER